MTNHIPNKPSDEAMEVAKEIERTQGRLLLLTPIARLIHAYAERVRAEERERCAGIAEAFDLRNGEPDSNYGGCIARLIRGDAKDAIDAVSQ